MFRRIMLFSLLTVTLIFGVMMSSTVAASGPAPFKVAALQFNPTLNERDKNVDQLLIAIEEAFQNGAKLVVTPEMSTTGYIYSDRKAIAAYVDTIPGSTTARLAKLTRKYGSYVVVGMAEKDAKTKSYYNSAALVGPKGYIGKYRKMHLWEPDMHWSAWGDLGVPVYNTAIGKIAMNICMDSIYYESARLAAVGGADILACPTNSSMAAVFPWQARAVQNGLFVVGVNRSNTENIGKKNETHMTGVSSIWSPEGEKLAE
jgi:predicted amidohydrolase